MEESFALLVEDDPDDQEFVLAALSGPLAARCRIAADGQEALDLLLPPSRESLEMPVAMIIDLMMPKVHGLEVIDRLRRHEATANLPVIVFSSSQEPRDIQRSYELGANSYVPKPLDPDQFRLAVRDIFTFWLIRNAPPPLVAP